jgi:DNA-binding NtrC family response regulator
MEYDWPGNVRELENEVRRMAALARDEIDEEVARPLLERHRHGDRRLDGALAGRTLQEIEREAILRTLEACAGHKARAAEMLGIPRRTFYDKLKRHRIL